MNDEATRIAQVNAGIARLQAVTDLPPDAATALAAAGRKMLPTHFDGDYFGPGDAWGAGHIVALIDLFLTERTMRAAWRKRAEEAEGEPTP